MNAIDIQNPVNDSFLTDLSAQVSKTTLIRFTFEAVAATNWPTPLQLDKDRTPEPVLRTLLPYCYCVGIFSSRDIEIAAQFDASVRYLCANDIPTFDEVRQFRRKNVSWLRETLARMLLNVGKVINATPDADSFLPLLVEADRRLRLAIEADSAALDV